MHYDTRLMTTRKRLLFILMAGLLAAVARGGEETRSARTAPDQPGVGAGSSPVAPIAPKRSFNERVTFHEVDPLLPEKPRKKSVEPQLEPEGRPQPRMPKPMDPRTDAPRRPPPEPPTKEEIQEELRKRNWLDPSKFEDSTAKEDRRRIDSAMGLTSDEDEDPDTTESETNGEKPGGEPASFGDFFDRMREQALELARVNDEEASAEEEEESREKEESKKKSAAEDREEREEKRSQRMQAESGAGAAFNPLETGRPSEAKTNQAQAGGPTTLAGEAAPPSFTPVFPSPQSSRPPATRELAATPSGFSEERGASRASNSFDLSTPGLGQEPSTSRLGNTDPVTGSFRQMDLRDYRDTRVPDRPGQAGNPYGAADEASRSRDNVGQGSFRPAQGAGGYAPSGFAGFDSGAPPSPRTSIAPPPGTGFQSGFSALRSAAILPPSVGNTEPARADRWEKDRMKSQLLNDGPSAGFGTRKP